MYRLLFIVLLSSISFAANSQITKGNWMLGGNISYTSTRYNRTNFGNPHTNYNLHLSPSIGYFFINKLAVGFKAGINKSGDKLNKVFSTDFNLGPYFRYYLLASEKQVNVLTETAYLYGYNLTTNSEKFFKNTFFFSVGPVIYLNNSVGLEFLVNYSTYKYSIVEGSNNTLRFSMGLQIHFEKKN